MNLLAYTQRAEGLETLRTYIDSKLVEVNGSFRESMDSPGEESFSSESHLVHVVCDPSGDFAAEVAEEAPNGDHLVLASGAELGPQGIAHAVGSGVDVHIAGLGVTVWGSRSDPSPAAALATSGAAAEHDQLRQYAGGRPPLGTKVVDGWLVPADEFDHVREVLSAYREERLDLAAAADRLDTTEKTIRKAADRTALYRLE